MVYQTPEISDQDGERIALYEIQWGATVWRYTSADRDITVLQTGVEVTYTAVACWDDGVKQGGDNQDLSIHLPSNIPLADLFHSTPPANRIRVTVRRRHATDPDGEAFIYWKGYLGNLKRDPGGAGVSIICNTLLGSFDRQGLRLTWTRGCPHVLYDSECRVNPEDFALDTTIIGLAGNSITVADDGGKEIAYYSGGYVEWDVAPGTVERRGITLMETTTKLFLLGTTYRMTVGMSVRLYPGCDLTMETCRAKFSNGPNYGGCKQMTGKNPFDGTPII